MNLNESAQHNDHVDDDVNVEPQIDEHEQPQPQNVEPSPLGHSRESSVVRKEVNHNISGCAQGVNDGLDGMLQHLKAVLPSPAVNNTTRENTKNRASSKKKQIENDKRQSKQS